MDKYSSLDIIKKEMTKKTCGSYQNLSEDEKEKKVAIWLRLI